MKTCSASFFALLCLACTVHIATSATLHVWQNSPNPAAPYDSWSTAAHVIQDAVDAAAEGDTVRVTNGVYTTGGRAVVGTMTNRVAVDRAITLLSVNGPEVTVIKGAEAPGGGNGDGAIRCAYLGHNAVLDGFALEQGHTRTKGDYAAEQSGGGVWGEVSGVATNCIIRQNSGWLKGGGALGGTYWNCVFTWNSTCGEGGGAAGWLHPCVIHSSTLTMNSAVLNGGGAREATLENCMLSLNMAQSGGGALGSTLWNCRLVGNTANYSGGGTYHGRLYNCVLTGNTAEFGGGACGGSLYHCTVTGNSASAQGGGTLGEAPWDPCVLYNSINYDNTAPDGPNHYLSTLAYSCTMPSPTNGTGNIDVAPALLNVAAGDFRLAPGSPCIDAGSDFDLGDGTYLSDIITNDLDGNPRPLDGDGDGIDQFDMGAYEFVRELFPNEELAALIDHVAQSDMPASRKTPLLASLLAAQASVDRGSLRSGVNQLSAFEHKVLAQVARVDADLAAQLLQAAERIIGALCHDI